MIFCAALVDRKLIPDDVEIQVLVQCREHLIKRTFEALEGIKKAIVHIYNSTSTLQRDVVFHKDKDEIKDIAIIGTKLVQRYAAGVRRRGAPGVFPGELYRHGAGFCAGYLHGGSGDMGRYQGESHYHQPPVHR